MVADIENARQNGRSVCLFLGAGTSRIAGIPDANGFVEDIKNKYPVKYEGAKRQRTDGIEPGYAECMSQLHMGQQHDLVQQYIQNAKINWAHVAAAQLLEHGYVDRFVTTNFDPLISRSCALLNKFPAVYDFASLRDEHSQSVDFIDSFVKGPAIYHLHGQHTGFLLLNNEQQMQDQAVRLKPVLQEAFRDRFVIVCGYSGATDPLVAKMRQCAPFPYGFCWFTRNEDEPASQVQNELLTQCDGAYVARDAGADEFFVRIAQKLEIFPPTIVQHPFDHILTLYQRFAPFNPDVDEIDILELARERVEQAKSQQPAEGSDADRAFNDFLRGKHEDVIRQFSDAAQQSQSGDQLASIVALAYFAKGNESVHTLPEDASERWSRLNEAIDWYRQALEIKPDNHAALNNLGVALQRRANLQATHANKRSDLNAAIDRFRRALDIKPDKHEALQNWGIALARRSELQATHADKRSDLDAAIDRYRQVLEIKPDMHEKLYNLGNMLGRRSELQATHADKRGDLDAAIDRFRQAVEIKPDTYDALYNLSNTLIDRAKLESSQHARMYLLRDAADKAEQADAIEAGAGAYNRACAAALLGHLEDARRWLEHAEAHTDLPDPAHLQNDSDMDPLRDEPWFQDLLARARGGGSAS